MIIDNHHIVALSENSKLHRKKVWRIKKYPSWWRRVSHGNNRSSNFVYFQTKNINDLVDYLGIKEMTQRVSPSSDSRSIGISLGGFKIGT